MHINSSTFQVLIPLLRLSICLTVTCIHQYPSVCRQQNSKAQLICKVLSPISTKACKLNDGWWEGTNQHRWQATCQSTYHLKSSWGIIMIMVPSSVLILFVEYKWTEIVLAHSRCSVHTMQYENIWMLSKVLIIILHWLILCICKEQQPKIDNWRQPTQFMIKILQMILFCLYKSDTIGALK